MTLKEYQEFVFQCGAEASKATQKDAMLTGVLGLCGETGELVDHVKKVLYHGHPLDPEYIKLELGDILWYLAWMAYAQNMSLDEILQANVDKLRARYPSGTLTTKESMNR